MPRKIVVEDGFDRSNAAATTFDDEPKRGIAMRVLLYSPKDMIAGAIALAAIGAVLINAFFMQPGPHPFPMFGETVTLLPPPPAVSPLPKPRPADAIPKDARRSEDLQPPETKPDDFRTVSDPIAAALKSPAAGGSITSTIRPPATIPAAHRNDAPGDAAMSPRRVAAVQKVLSQNGYGQLKPTGSVGPETRAAIQKFERDHKLPVTGHVSDKLMRQMAAANGRPVE